jgi:predicted amidohydrolase YtcJ
MKLCTLFFGALLFLMGMQSCQSLPEPDLLLTNGHIYTLDSNFTVAEAIAVKDGKILEVGTTADLQKKYAPKQTIDLKGTFLYPGFIDAHAHFLRYGLGLRTCDLTSTNSWEEVVSRLQTFAASIPKGEWIVGRGWDQNDWDVKEFPVNDKLNQLFPDHPVILTRVDGHGAIVNDVALLKAGITAATKLTGGNVLLQNGKPTGVLIDNAIDLVAAVIPPPSEKQIKEALLAAQKNCFAAGLTTVDDCGLDYDQVLQIEKAYSDGDFKMRLYVMLSDAKKNYDAIFQRGKIKTDRLNVRSFKVYADGALGSRGACLLQPYADKPGQYGFLLSQLAHFDSVAAMIYAKGFQMNTHAIGDSGNRALLHIYAKYLKGPNDLRWRIEHAQVVSPVDFNLFGQYNIIPSVQPTHATSDMYWAGQRLGAARVKERMPTVNY